MSSTAKKPEEKKLINFLRGWPSPHILPNELLKKAATTVFSDPHLFVPGLQYGPDPGYEPLRQQLAQFLGSFYNIEPNPNRICITGGASQSMACILQSYTDPVYTQTIWAIAPCYYLACPIFEDAGFKNRLHAVPEDDEGIDLEFLQRGLKSVEAKQDQSNAKPVYKEPGPLRKVYRHIIYVVPTSANPSGKTMSLSRRQGLVHLARKYNALVVCDDVYDFLQWPVISPSITTTPSKHKPQATTLPVSSRLPRLSDIDNSLGPSTHDLALSPTNTSHHFGHAISNGSFSKIVGPGVRTGWVEASQPAFAFGLAQTGSTKSGGAPSQITAAMICEMMKSGDLERHITQTAVPDLQRRHGLLMDSIRREIVGGGGDVGACERGPRVEIRKSSLKDSSSGIGEADDEMEIYGGYFVWITFPDGPLATEIAKKALEEENLIIPTGTMFEVKGDEKAFRFENSIRLCFSWEDEEDIVDGIQRLGRVIRSLQG